MSTWARVQLKRVARVLGGEEGQGMVEYGLIVALIAIAVVTVLTTFGDNLSTMVSNLASWVANKDPGAPAP